MSMFMTKLCRLNNINKNRLITPISQHYAKFHTRERMNKIWNKNSDDPIYKWAKEKECLSKLLNTKER